MLFSHRALLLFAWGGSLLSSGCLNHPSPLTPGLSGSVGVPHHGVLTESAELPERGEGYRRYRPRAPVYHGLPRLVRAIERAAATVDRERPGGARLIVGDLSAATGGKIPRHNSHRTGRDVDFLFYVTSPEGVPVENPGFYSLDADGFAELPDGRFIRLDVARQWLFYKTLLSDEEIDVQYLFMSRALEGLLMDYALARETDLALLWKAQTVIVQPGDSLPHDDHVHMRIACQPDEAVRGCLGGGPYWPWLTPLPHLGEDLEELWSAIRQTDPLSPSAPSEELLATEDTPNAPPAPSSHEELTPHDS